MGQQGSFPALEKVPYYSGPKAPAAPKAKKAKKAKPPCKYGPRLANGRCPTKPKTVRAAAAGQVKNIVRAAGATKGGAVEKVSTAVGGALAVSAARIMKGRMASTSATALGSRLAAVGPRASLALKGGSVLAAGLLSYYLTKSLIDSRRAAKMQRAELAALAADAYREARLSAIEMNGGQPLRGKDQQALANAFKAQLVELGLASDDLRGL